MLDEALLVELLGTEVTIGNWIKIKRIRSSLRKVLRLPFVSTTKGKYTGEVMGPSQFIPSVENEATRDSWVAQWIDNQV